MEGTESIVTDDKTEEKEPEVDEDAKIQEYIDDEEEEEELASGAKSRRKLKAATHKTTILQMRIAEYPTGVFIAVGDIMKCCLCDVEVGHLHAHRSREHLGSSKHKNKLPAGTDIYSRPEYKMLQEWYMKKLNERVAEYSDEGFVASGDTMRCNLCNIQINYIRKCRCDGHIDSNHHKEKKAEYERQKMKGPESTMVTDDKTIEKESDVDEKEELASGAKAPSKRKVSSRPPLTAENRIAQYPAGPFKAEHGMMKCSLCDAVVDYKHPNRAREHLYSQKHKANLPDEVDTTSGSKYMPQWKYEDNDKKVLNKRAADYLDESFVVVGSKLLCAACNVEIEFRAKNRCDRHIQTTRHQDNKRLYANQEIKKSMQSKSSTSQEEDIDDEQTCND